MPELKTGQKAPSFELLRDGGGTLKLSDFGGKAVVLYFYPQDDTETCTAEAIEFSKARSDFERAGAVIVGVSPDSVRKHDRFKTKHKLTVDLGADEERKAIEPYGVWAEKTMFGRKYMGVVRSTFLIAPDGTIARIWRNVRLRGHVEEVLAAVKAL
ncbi:peroxiredoxin [Mesorhizobium sp. L-8-10]|uniref:peroxiredoxin n=1 Tax=unclassified Mesorhizobium TaxID=325217 RepID=UPI00192774C6|nr:MULTISPECIES: peroxiredoxin [unclassified Mesorhizobium]BCH24764.1 peroxiredoxin [Mesorhizobium sp. L-8-3]BCH32501.1 peroxiredoxin [Mesorhizobium sp. L-8-10]